MLSPFVSDVSGCEDVEDRFFGQVFVHWNSSDEFAIEVRRFKIEQLILLRYRQGFFEERLQIALGDRVVSLNGGDVQVDEQASFGVLRRVGSRAEAVSVHFATPVGRAPLLRTSD